MKNFMSYTSWFIYKWNKWDTKLDHCYCHLCSNITFFFCMLCFVSFLQRTFLLVPSPRCIHTVVASLTAENHCNFCHYVSFPTSILMPLWNLDCRKYLQSQHGSMSHPHLPAEQRKVRKRILPTLQVDLRLPEHLGTAERRNTNCGQTYRMQDWKLEHL